MDPRAKSTIINDTKRIKSNSQKNASNRACARKKMGVHKKLTPNWRAYTVRLSPFRGSLDKAINAEEAPIKTYGTVQTMGKTIAGGAKAGLTRVA